MKVVTWWARLSRTQGGDLAGRDGNEAFSYFPRETNCIVYLAALHNNRVGAHDMTYVMRSDFGD